MLAGVSPDATMKANTPPVDSPTYSTDIVTFVNANVPDTWNGKQVNFLQIERIDIPKAPGETHSR